MAYVGSNSIGPDILGGRPRFFYGLRRTDSGDLYIQKIDTVYSQDSANINNPGDQVNNFLQVDEGVDFFEGRDVYHNVVYPNLNYEQYRWDDVSINYYMDESTGELVARINQIYSYPASNQA
jgi:hypothetical protein